jgi:type VI secretion system protein ImpC
MAIQISFGTIRTGVQEAATETPVSSTPFRIAVLGDFTGRASRGICEAGAALAKRRPIVVDRDNLEEVLARLDVELHLPAGDGQRMAVQFRELDDFLPDRLVQQVGVFDRLRELRRKLSNSATFAQAAQEVRSWGTSKPAPPAAAPVPGPPAPTTAEDALALILGETPAPSSKPPSVGGVDWNSFLQQVVGPYALAKPDPQQGELVAQVDSATSGLMRALLHQADFQSLEAAWRGLYFLTRRLETDSSLKVAIIDISRAELAADLAGADDLTATATYKLLVEQTVGTPGAATWAVLAGLYTFAPARADAELLGRLAKIARHAGAPLLAGASPACVGCASLAATPDPDDWTLSIPDEDRAAWEAVRRLPEATAVGLALPRFLLRLPHGKDTTPVDSFDFEEVPDGAAHESYLWGNPALACAYLLGEAFSRHGWDFQPGMVAQIDNLPVHVYHQAGEAMMKPCAEVVLSERAAERLGQHGIIPLLSMQDRDVVQLGGFYSLAGPGSPLAGRWQGK